MMDALIVPYDFFTEGVPSYRQAFEDVVWGVKYCYENCSYETSFGPAAFFSALSNAVKVETEDIAAVLGVSLLWTLLRIVLTLILFKPCANYFELVEPNKSKFPESAMKFLIYTGTWVYSCYVIFGLPQYNHVYYDPVTLWKDYTPSLVIETEVYILYMLQLGLYVHSIYASLFMDHWRKDTPVMILHHCLAISLLTFSYLCRYYKIGVLVIFCHDLTDVFLEFTKCNVYFKIRAGRFYKVHDAVATVGFLLFAAAWWVCRLYWLPLKVLHSTGYGAMLRYQEAQNIKFYFFFNSMLWILQVLNIYWFMFIVNFIFKVATGQMQEVDDIREEGVLTGETLKKADLLKNSQKNGSGNGHQKGDRINHAKPHKVD